MDTDNTTPQRPASRQPQPGMTPRTMGQPAGRRPMVDGFVPHRPNMPGNHAPARPTHPGARQITVGDGASAPAAAPAPAPQPARPAQPIAARPVNTDFAPRTQPIPESRAHVPEPQVREFTPPPQDLPPAGESKPAKERSETGHSGLVGLVLFIVLGALLASPFLPGKIMGSFPLTSDSFSTGDQSLDCISTQGKVTTTTTYNSKLGAPITYSYTNTTTQSAMCGSQNQTATTGHESQFNPLGLLIDILVALIIAIIVARIWRFIFGKKQRRQ